MGSICWSTPFILCIDVYCIVLYCSCCQIISNILFYSFLMSSVSLSGIVHVVSAERSGRSHPHATVQCTTITHWTTRHIARWMTENGSGSVLGARAVWVSKSFSQNEPAITINHQCQKGIILNDIEWFMNVHDISEILWIPFHTIPLYCTSCSIN